MGFRKLFNWRYSALDFVLHLGLALAIPGPWWFQYVPDMMLPFIFTHSLMIDGLLPETTIVVKMHKYFHTLWPVLILSILAGMMFDVQIALLGIHWGCHILVDQFTHPQKEFRKELL